MKNNSKIAIVVSKFNQDITKSLLRCCTNELVANGIHKKNITTVQRVTNPKFHHISSENKATKKTVIKNPKISSTASVSSVANNKRANSNTESTYTAI